MRDVVFIEPDMVGVDAEMIRQYVKYQEKLERNLKLDF